jgi:hypothetical protein
LQADRRADQAVVVRRFAVHHEPALAVRPAEHERSLGDVAAGAKPLQVVDVIASGSEPGGVRFYFPIVTSLIISFALSLILWLLNR